MLSRTIGDYHFLADSKTGTTFRWGKTFDDDPLFAPVPELADISISNRCHKGCGFCYRQSTGDGALMSLKDYCDVLDSMNSPEYGNVFQVALGGGEPLEHPDFMEIINETVKRGIVPNFTTNGALLTESLLDDIRGKVGALAISISDVEEIIRLKDILSASLRIKVNLHYILSRRSVEQAIDIVRGKYDHLLDSINAVIFLTYKPAGRGSANDVLMAGKELSEFLHCIKHPQTMCRIGFDACFVPMILSQDQTLSNYVDFCEGGFFSVYINEKKEVSPCSFSNGKDAYSLDEYDFYDIWLNKFQLYRNKQTNRCAADCSVRHLCRGACPYYPHITTCYK